MATNFNLKKMYNSEFSVLSCLFQDPGLHDLGLLDEKDFENHICKKVFALMQKYYNDGKRPDTSVLALASDNWPLLETIARVKEFEPTTTFFREYVDDLKNKRVDREKDLLAPRIASMKLDQIQEEINNIYKNTVKDDRPIGVDRLINDYDKHLCEKENTEIIPTGLKKLDKLGIFKRKRLIVLGALTNIGKSALALNIATEAAESGKKVLFVTMEMSANDLTERLISFYSGSSDQTREQIKIAKTSIQELKHLRVIEAMNQTSQQLYGTLIRESSQYGTDLIVIDYLQKFTDKCEKGETTAMVMNRIMSKIFDASLKTNSVILAISQFNRDASPGKKIPTMNMFKDSSSIEQAASAVMILHRENTDSLDATLSVPKNRHGKCVMFNLKFDPVITKFYEQDWQDKIMKGGGIT